MWTSLEGWGSTRAEEFRAACDARFVEATVFKTPEEAVALRKLAVADTMEGEVAAGEDDIEKTK